MNSKWKSLVSLGLLLLLVLPLFACAPTQKGAEKADKTEAMGKSETTTAKEENPETATKLGTEDEKATGGKIKDNEVAARSIGIHVYRHKIYSFALAAALAGAAGSFYAFHVNYVDSTTFGFEQSILILSMTILGGMGNLAGSILGAVFYTVLPELLRFVNDYRQVIYGLVLVLMIMFKPSGLLGNVNLRQIRLYHEEIK